MLRQVKLGRERRVCCTSSRTIHVSNSRFGTRLPSLSQSENSQGALPAYDRGRVFQSDSQVGGEADQAAGEQLCIKGGDD